MTQEDLRRTDLGFVREDIGLAILGAFAAVVGIAVANGTTEGSATSDVFTLIGMAGVILVIVRVIHLGYRLAFPKKR